VADDDGEKLSGDELIEKWRNDNRAYCLEGDSGLENLEKLCRLLGYGHGFRWGDPIQHFLSDNSGACEAIVDFISEWTERNAEWREALEESLGQVDGADCPNCGEDRETCCRCG
jgi:hypothetical protein